MLVADWHLHSLPLAGLPPVTVPINLEETQEAASVTSKSVETERIPPIGSSDDPCIDWSNIDVERFVVPEDKAERQRLLRAIRDEFAVRLNRQKQYVIAVYFKRQDMARPDPASVKTDKLIELMKRFPIVRSLKR
ncbi:hypothetical protein HJA90_09615 [Rhizobium bangladeshense]|uniref:hypothetical protein n=1 Tax=Rhizobium bangladeshense TaxID=1138189 RepID=UPI001C83422E|nr:hypothetical protein [Rhizobium bangladeshense]MBX4883845.1 hypothetical protein [Rhizobium bangladeshense]